MHSPADRLAEAVVSVLARWDAQDPVTEAMHDALCDLKDAIDAYRSAPPVDIEACARAAARTFYGDDAEGAEMACWIRAIRAVLREAGVIE